MFIRVQSIKLLEVYVVWAAKPIYVSPVANINTCVACEGSISTDTCLTSLHTTVHLCTVCAQSLPHTPLRFSSKQPALGAYITHMSMLFHGTLGIRWGLTVTCCFGVFLTHTGARCCGPPQDGPNFQCCPGPDAHGYATAGVLPQG